ncbi:MAG: hypothetical protein ACRERC_03300 [Candidatus Binatia bacterium]
MRRVEQGLYRLAVCAAVVAALGVYGCSSDGGDDTTGATATLITLDAPAGSLVAAGTAPDGAARYDLILAGVSERAVAFADRPVRKASLVPVSDLVADWERDGLADAPPSALLTVRDDEGGTWIEAFLLSAPQLAGGALRFTADSVDGITAIPPEFIDVDLFLEPASPESPGRIFAVPGGAGTIARNQGPGARSWTLSVDAASPVAAYLWSGAPPVAGPIDTAALVANWASFGFDDVPPNASLTVRDGDETATAVLTLADPLYDAESASLRFVAADVAGTGSLPASFAESDLFIDTAGAQAEGGRSTAFDKLIGVDYDFEARCADDNWSTTNPAACNPQPSFICPSEGLALCPARCQACFDADLADIKGLGVGAITIYNPNWYALSAAQKVGTKVLLGTFNDTLGGLAQPDATSGCTYSGSPTACGPTYGRYLIDGACGSQSPWDPSRFCGDGQTFITPWQPFLQAGTVIGIQIGNEVLVNGFNQSQVLAAAQTLRGVLDARGYTPDKVPIVISLVLGEENSFCANGAPPANVDFIAAHPYCNSVAGLPPQWPASGSACLDQVKRDFVNISQKQCGASHVFIGETGFNSGCPGVYGTQYVADATTFVAGVTQWACEQSLGLFHFAYVDACPAGGCLAGCASKPAEGNGYFGLYYTDGYLTKGPLVPKLSPMPSLVCP